ncbi:unnamed protein product [Caretta caretta]
MAYRAAEPRIPMTLQRAGLKAEEKTLDFEFEVVNVQFNEKGRYALRLTVENPLLEGSGAGVCLRVNEGDVLYTSSGTTDVIEQSNLSEIYAFERRRFLFTLPKGFCKNDKNHDVRLRIEALQLCGPSLKSSLRAGEAFFAIYPRTNQPRMNLFAGKDEDLYHYSNIMALLRVGEDELAMHCGRLAYAVSFHEHRLPARKETPVSSYQFSPWLSARKDGEQDGVYTPRVPFPAPLLSMDGPLHSYHRSTPEALTSSAYHLPPIESRTLSAEGCQGAGHAGCFWEPPEYPDHLPQPDEKLITLHTQSLEKQVHELLGEPDQRAFPELRNDSADKVCSSSSPSSSPAVPRRLLSNASFHLSSPGHSPELGSQDPFAGVQVLEAPSGMDEPMRTSETNHWHLAHSGKESISVTLHSATNLPATRKGNVPWPYVTVKSNSDVEKKLEAQGVTHVSSEPTQSPTWEEKVTMEIDAEDAGHEAVNLTVADKITKEVLVSYKIPVRYLRSFHHYHLRLVLPRKKDPLGTSLYATVVRKGSLIPRYVGMNYTGLEVFLQGMKNPLADPQGPTVAIARVVNNFNAYREAMKMQPTTSPAVDLTTITFPDPSMVAFDVLRVTNQGYPQVGGQCVFKNSYSCQNGEGSHVLQY